MIAEIFHTSNYPLFSLITGWNKLILDLIFKGKGWLTFLKVDVVRYTHIYILSHQVIQDLIRAQLLLNVLGTYKSIKDRHTIDKN